MASSLSWSSLGSSRRLGFCILCGLSVSVFGHYAVCYNIASSSSHRESTLVFPGTRSHVSPYRLTSTTLPLCHCARVYHNIHNNMYALAVALNRQTVRLLRCVCFCLFTLLLYPRLYLPVCIHLNSTYEDCWGAPICSPQKKPRGTCQPQP